MDLNTRSPLHQGPQSRLLCTLTRSEVKCLGFDNTRLRSWPTISASKVTNPLHHQYALLDQFHAYSLSDLSEQERNQHMLREDVKFLFPMNLVPMLLERLNIGFKCLNVGGHRLHHYRNMYYDTDKWALYHKHHNEHQNRYKLRLRDYLSSGKRYLEIKFHGKRGLTKKIRIETSTNGMDTLSLHRDFLAHFKIDAACFIPKLLNDYRRITLLNDINNERVSIDTQIQFKSLSQTTNESILQNFAIVEIKHNGHKHESSALSLMHQLGFRAVSFSKYCIAVATLFPKQVKTNRFKAILRQSHLLHTHEFRVEKWNGGA